MLIETPVFERQYVREVQAGTPLRHTYLAQVILWSRRQFAQSEALPLHSGLVDLCDHPKCGWLGCVISGSGGLRSRYPLKNCKVMKFFSKLSLFRFVSIWAERCFTAVQSVRSWRSWLRKLWNMPSTLTEKSTTNAFKWVPVFPKQNGYHCSLFLCKCWTVSQKMQIVFFPSVSYGVQVAFDIHHTLQEHSQERRWWRISTSQSELQFRCRSLPQSVFPSSHDKFPNCCFCYRWYSSVRCATRFSTNTNCCRTI